MAGVRGRIGAALRRAGDGSAAAAGKVTPDTAKAPAEKAVAKTSPAKAIKAEPAKKATARTAPAKTAAATKTAPAKRTPATKAAAMKAAATKAVAKTAPVTKAAARSATAKKTPVTQPATKTPPAKVPAKKVATTATKKGAATKAPAVSTSTAASPGSELSVAELAEIRSQLQAELAETQVEYEKSLSQLDDLRRSQDGAGDDQADTGSKTFEREQEQSIAANRQLLISQIQHAIERIDSGTYGTCEDCGKPIPKARLKALPMATLDAGCKVRAERH